MAFDERVKIQDWIAMSQHERNVFALRRGVVSAFDAITTFLALFQLPVSDFDDAR